MDCCPKCRESIYFNKQKSEDILDIVIDVEERLHKEIRETRERVDNFVRNLKGQVNYLQSICESQKRVIDSIWGHVTRLEGGGYQLYATWDEPEETYSAPPNYLPGENPLDGPVDDTHWFSGED